MITANATLANGLEIEPGKFETAIVMRAATIGDAVEAIEDAGPDAGFLRVKIHKIARCIVSVGELDTAAIKARLAARKTSLVELILALPEDDFAPLNEALTAAEKKPSASPTA
jgi:hypothetical protein